MKCELTDGVDVLEVREMTSEEMRQANVVARQDLYWTCEPMSAPCPSYGEDGDIS